MKPYALGLNLDWLDDTFLLLTQVLRRDLVPTNKLKFLQIKTNIKELFSAFLLQNYHSTVHANTSLIILSFTNSDLRI